MASIELNTEPRTALGKKTRALRREGVMPIHVYGLSADSLALQAPDREVMNVLRAAGRTRLVSVNVKGGKQETCLVRGLDVHPVTSRVLHVDFMRVGDAEVAVEVPIELKHASRAPVARGSSVNITQVLAKARIKALPQAIPETLVADCRKLAKITDTITCGELDIPDDVHLLSDPAVRVVSVQLTRAARAAQS